MVLGYVLSKFQLFGTKRAKSRFTFSITASCGVADVLGYLEEPGDRHAWKRQFADSISQ